MRTAATALVATGLALSACNQAKRDETVQAPPPTPAESPAPEGKPAKPDPVRPNQGSLPEPRGPIDPKSVEAAGQVVQHYGALVEQARFLQAERLWSDLNGARTFAIALHAKFRDLHLEIGDVGDTEGAAGSIYTTVPVTFYGTSEQGKPLRLPASVILRRVNDVPGSTERQRRWHIERIDWTTQPKAG